MDSPHGGGCLGLWLDKGWPFKFPDLIVMIEPRARNLDFIDKDTIGAVGILDTPSASAGKNAGMTTGQFLGRDRDHAGRIASKQHFYFRKKIRRNDCPTIRFSTWDASRQTR